MGVAPQLLAAAGAADPDAVAVLDGSLSQQLGRHGGVTGSAL